MLSILMLSQRGEGYGFKQRLENEGHLVKLWVEDPAVRASLPKGQAIDRYDQHIETADLVVECSSRFGGLCDELRERGKLVLGGRTHGVLERDREYALAVSKLLELEVDTTVEGLNLQIYGVFNGEEFTDVFYTHNYLRLLNNDRGPKFSSLGCVSRRVHDCVLLHKLRELLIQAGYKGILGVNTSLVDDRVVFKSFITSLTNVFMLGIIEHTKLIGETLFQLASGHRLNLTDEFAVSVVSKLLAPTELKIKTHTPADKHMFHELGGNTIITARGGDLREARRRVYRTVSNVGHQDLVYRTDIGYTPLWEESNERVRGHREDGKAHGWS